jgi:hypothetical protein
MPLLKGYGASEDLWVPVNYRQIAVHSPLPKDVYSWVRLTANDTESDIATFDILLTDNGGKVALEVSGFTIKRLAKNQVFAAARPPLPSELVPVDSPSAVTRNLSDAELGGCIQREIRQLDESQRADPACRPFCAAYFRKRHG